MLTSKFHTNIYISHCNTLVASPGDLLSFKNDKSNVLPDAAPHSCRGPDNVDKNRDCFQYTRLPAALWSPVCIQYMLRFRTKCHLSDNAHGLSSLPHPTGSS